MEAPSVNAPQALDWLRRMLGPAAQFRDRQWEAVDRVAHRRERLLVDDVCDSGWTLTLLAVLLRQHGSGPVYPFALAKASPRGR